jgi:hypothetical protein
LPAIGAQLVDVDAIARLAAPALGGRDRAAS